jgi:transcriptional regulator with XRE-family HTH domain
LALDFAINRYLLSLLEDNMSAKLSLLAHHLNAILREKRLTQSDVAGRMYGYTIDKKGARVARRRDRLSVWCAGKQYPSRENLAALAKALDVQIDALAPQEEVREAEALPLKDWKEVSSRLTRLEACRSRDDQRDARLSRLEERWDRIEPLLSRLEDSGSAPAAPSLSPSPPALATEPRTEPPRIRRGGFRAPKVHRGLKLPRRTGKRTRYNFDDMQHGDALECESMNQVNSAREVFRCWRKRTGRNVQLVLAVKEGRLLLHFIDVDR